MIAESSIRPARGGSLGDRPSGGLRAVLFDMDGTLIDSERLWTLALNEVAAGLGGRLSTATRRAMIGQDLVSSVGLLHQDMGYQGDQEITKRLLVDATARHFQTALEWRPGAAELLAAVRAAGLPMGLVTSTHRNLTAIALSVIGKDNFEVVVCGDDVEHTKPDPEPYRSALAQLDVDATQAVAIEDSVSGSTAALTAGLATLVVPAEVPVPARPGMWLRDSLTDVTVADLAALLRRHGPPER